MCIRDSPHNVVPLNVKFKVEEHLLVREPVTVGWWDHIGRKWSTLGVESSSFNPQTREVSCETVVFSPISLVQSKSLDIPYRSWFLTPTGLNRAMLSIEMKTHTIRVELTEHVATLLQPDLPELKAIFNKPMPPTSLAAALARSGFTINPVDADIEHVETLVAKEPLVEQQLHEDMSMLIQGYTFRGSVWNQAAGRNKCIVQAAEKPDYEIDPMTETYKGLLHMWENEAVKIGILQCDETAAIYKEKFETTHLRMENVLQPTMPDQSAANIRESSLPFQECVRHMLDATRLFSFC
eukprot:TRINITY_DN2377_c0_g2_i4.p1 TRINITY_DN2377_c0_g2~~TRINITY_DN2377_c0_g2_i4.p1  ORF type:complete len:295 (+),score=92.39 TRINITY_DN2377_c0_g2_i4:129-1013(+)